MSAATELREAIRKQLFATPAGSPNEIRNTLFFKILAANPFLAKIWREPLRQAGANSSVILDLEIQSGIFFDSDQPAANLNSEKFERL
jgi:hypothetical protein